MDVGHVLLLVAAGLAAGVVNAIAGGGSLITFPSLLGVGLPSVEANVTNSVSVFPGYVSSVAGSRADLAGQGRRAASILPTSALGGAAGCALLLGTPARAFEVVVPFLVLAATATLAFQERLRALVGRRSRAGAARRSQTGAARESQTGAGRNGQAEADRKSRTGVGQDSPAGPDRRVALHVVVFIGAVYGGYFGAALGVMYVAALALVLDESLNRINALKNVLSACVGLVTVVVFAIFAKIHWGAVLVVAPATVVGGYAGARLARRLPAPVLKALIVTFGAVIGVVLLWRAFR
ncbi:sulfite exporter TauE/SafE family protein [Couchioplanes caeruleus]|uniref:Probable membrane transporter protein n=2 Tax=Couchioplanes caeruleus TaxID=56438 RepID=A0A1K0FBM7_9ACTN|nr:sulfite exporter TauE/SafE family protein [Couchioplanes caeruleus]OJF10241.1 permease [Couchioplanes caeruleus subsp. caeruleus]ROP29380.1 hypothetical protein EDD30_2173 [Couchioplanes caeruleus]